MGPVFLALKEMRRAKVRFGLLTAAVGLLVFLVLFQQSLQNGLLTAFVGGIRNQSAPVLVYSVDGRRNLQGGVIIPQLEQQILAVDGIARAGRFSQSTFTATAGGEQIDAAVVGFEAEGLGSPETLAAGRLPVGPAEAVANSGDAARGFDIGDVVTLDPAGFEITVVGLADDVLINVTPTLYVLYPTYEDAVRSRFPGAAEVLPNALAIQPAEGVSPAELVERINAVSDDADALVRADAADKAPGVSSVRQSFSVIFLLYALVVPFVTGLFFLILTFQKANALTLLRAIGAPGGKLVQALMVQVAAVLVGGLALGIAFYAPVSVQRLGDIALRFETGAVVFWSVLLLSFGLLSALFSARRVLQIDPVSATTGAGVGR